MPHSQSCVHAGSSLDLSRALTAGSFTGFMTLHKLFHLSGSLFPPQLHEASRICLKGLSEIMHVFCQAHSRSSVNGICHTFVILLH